MKVAENRKLFIVCLLAFIAISYGMQKKSGKGAAYSEITYDQSSENFSNPERGFYQQFAANSERPGLNIAQLKALKDQNMTMILRIYYLEKFKDRALSGAELSLIRDDMQVMREAGVKCILRFAYTSSMTVSDAPLFIVEQHLDQLKPIFESNRDVIAFVQAGFIGAWGEWHSSSNGLASVENQRKVLFKLLSVLPAEIMVQVRTPGQKQEIFETTTAIGPGKAYTGDKASRVGHHNDCFMTNATDYGTYSKDKVEAEKQYISDEGLYVPTGGETCPPVPANNAPGCAIAASTMRYLRWTYLHIGYYKPTINAWKAAGCFEEIQRDLGYRLSLQTASLPDRVATNKAFKINIKIANKGYAPLYNYKITSLVFKNQAGTVHEITIPVDLRECKPSGELLINKMVKAAGIPPGTYNLYLKISDKSDKLKNRSEYSIRLANINTWDEAGGMNDLKHQIVVTR